MKSLAEGELADPILYRVYWGLMMNDILHKQGLDATKENKKRLHEFHKKLLGYRSTAMKSQYVFSMFLFEIGVYWSVEHGIFVRTSAKQPYDIENRPLAELWSVL